jgi:hypothetical protein
MPLYQAEKWTALFSCLLGVATVVGLALSVLVHGGNLFSSADGLVFIFLVPIVVFAAFGLGSYLHSRSAFGLVLLWMSWICLVIYSAIFIWIWLIPALLLGLVAGIAGLKAQGRGDAPTW